MTTGRPVVCVVDDDVSVRRAVTRLLRSAGYAVEQFQSGREFLLAMDTQERSGCVVLDIRMPGMSGLDVVHGLSARGLALPVILITGDGDIPTALRAISDGCSSFLDKPFEDDTLLEAVRRALQQEEPGTR
jgi:two-component system response regulator FixJ